MTMREDTTIRVSRSTSLIKVVLDLHRNRRVKKIPEAVSEDEVKIPKRLFLPLTCLYVLMTDILWEKAKGEWSIRYFLQV